MKFTRKMLATCMIATTGAAGLALGLSATAAADPAAAPAPAPSVPGLPFLQQLVTNPAAATQLIQGLTSMLGSAQAAAPAAAATPAPAAAATPAVAAAPTPAVAAAPTPAAAAAPTPAPAATASVTLPQPAAPAAAPAPATAPATAGQNLLPSGEMNIPNMPFLPVPLPQQVSFPGDLAALMPSGLLPGAKPAAAPVAPAAAPAPAPAAPAPAAAAPAAPAPGVGLAPLVMPLSALP